jgi:peptide/nickel transport system substrate-binding protein
MAENPVIKLNDLYLQFAAGKIDRRQFVARAATLGLSAASLAHFFRAIPASAQDATPATTYPPFTSIKRDQWKAQLAEQFPFTKDIGAQQTGGKVIYGDLASSDMNTFNGILADSAPTIEFTGLMFETLVSSSPIDGQYAPGLADYWEIAADGKTYTFHLHPGIKWHDGQPFTADDVVFSLAAQANPDTGSSYTSTFNATVASFSKVDDLTVKIVATDVFAQVVFLGNSYCPIMPKHLWENVAAKDWKSDKGSTGQDPSRVVGTGFVKFKERNEGEATTTWDINKDYWDGPAVYDQLLFQTRPDDTAAVEALRAGEIDVFNDVPQPDVASLNAEPDINVSLYDTFSFGWYGYNLDPTKTPLFQEKEVRQALFYAIDRQSIVHNILLDLAEVANGTQPKLSIAYAPDKITTVYDYDPAKANQMLDAAGWAKGSDGIREKNGNKLKFEVMYGSGSATSDQIIAKIQEDWKNVGAEMTPSAVDFSQVLVPAITDTHNFQICFLGFEWDVTGDQSAMFSTDSYHGGFNVMKYSNPQVDELNKQASRELDQEKRKQLLIQSSNLVNEDLPVGVLWFRKGRTGYNKKRLHNFSPNALAGWYWSLPYVWVSQ